MDLTRRNKATIWALAGACLLTVAISSAGAFGAVEGTVRKAAPSWLSLFSVTMKSDGSIYIVGSKALFMVSTDHGKTWLQRMLPERPGSTLFQDRDLYSIRFTADGKTGWICGEEGIMLHTTDGGETWLVQSGGNMGEYTIGPFFTITFTDPQHGIAAGLSGDLATTSDGGNTWQPAKLPDSSATYTFTDNTTTKRLWAGGTGGRMFGQNASGQWQKVEQVTFRDITDIAFVGNEGVAVGLNGTILLTSNAGEQWQAVQ